MENSSWRLALPVPKGMFSSLELCMDVISPTGKKWGVMAEVEVGYGGWGHLFQFDPESSPGPSPPSLPIPPQKFFKVKFNLFGIGKGA